MARLALLGGWGLVSVTTATGVWVDCTHGHDGGDGSARSPFRTLAKARDFVRSLPRPLASPVVVNVAGGVCYTKASNSDSYNFASAVLELDDPVHDSGEPGHPITWKAAGGPGSVELSGGLPLPGAVAWTPYSAATGCFQLDLQRVPGYNSSFGLGALQPIPLLGTCPNAKAELFDGSAPTVRARYPNLGPNGDWRWMQAKATGHSSLVVEDDRPLRKGWASSGEKPFLHGFWQYDWADSYVRLSGTQQCSSGEASCSILQVDPTTPPVYDKFLSGCRFLAVDLLQELDAPGESYLDAKQHVAYYCPPSGSLDPHDGHYHISMAGNAVHIIGNPGQDVHHVNLVGFKLSHTRKAGLSANAVSDVTFDSLTVEGGGGLGLSVGSALRTTISKANVTGTGCGGLSVSGGDVRNLVRAETVVSDSHVSHFANALRAYVPGISWQGVGLSFLRNEIAFGPHAGMSGLGNDCTFQGNHFHDLCTETSDSGAWYSGRSWVRRGNKLLDNVFERIRNLETTSLGDPAVQAIYLDDQMSGHTVTGNTVRDSYRGLQLGGGRDNIISGNHFEHVQEHAITFDNRGMGWQHPYCVYNRTDPGSSGQLVRDLFAVKCDQPPYSTAYPALATILSDNPGVPVNNIVTQNTYCAVAKGFIDRDAATVTSWHSSVTDNTESCRGAVSSPQLVV